MLKLVLHIARGASLAELLGARVAVVEGTHSIDLGVAGVLVFSNFLSLKTRLDRLPLGKIVRVDLRNARLVDHSCMEHLCNFAEDYAQSGGSLILTGLDEHRRSSDHPLSTGALPVQKPAQGFASFL